MPDPQASHPRHHHAERTHSRKSRRAAVSTLVAGILALAWLALRSGTKPSRVTYPCQQAAFSAANLVFGVPLVAGLLALRHRAAARSRAAGWIAVAAIGLTLSTSAWVYFSWAASRDVGPTGPAPLAPTDYRAELFHVDGCPEDPAQDRLVGFDNLLAVMDQGGLAFYRSPTDGPAAAPDGIVGPEDVVLIKINYQWAERGGTNTDLLRGVIRRIVDHPDGFTGEIVVCENAQFASTNDFDRPLNNAQDHGLSPYDVIVAFQNEGVNASLFDWTPIRYNSVSEYSEGDMNDGYVVYPYDAEISGRPSYPKFQTAAGTYISVRDGIWDPGSETYDRSQFRFINIPVLKSHHAVYGATVSVKHYMGVVTRELSTNSHVGIRYGLLGAVLAEIELADLNILDAIWINANPLTGPSTPYGTASRRNELVASLDPVALDIWSVKNILIPGFYDNGFSPPWPTPSADPDDPSSAFRVYLDNSMGQLLDAGYLVTNDLASIDVRNGNGGAGDFDADGDVDATDYASFADCFTGDGVPLEEPACSAGDFDGDFDIDCLDWGWFTFVWTEAGDPPDLPDCSPSQVPGEEVSNLGSTVAVYPNPMRGIATISYHLPAPAQIEVSVVDVSGRVVCALYAGGVEAGPYEVDWDGRDDDGAEVPAGVYFSRVQAGAVTATGRIVLAR